MGIFRKWTDFIRNVNTMLTLRILICHYNRTMKGDGMQVNLTSKALLNQCVIWAEV